MGWWAECLAWQLRDSQEQEDALVSEDGGYASRRGNGPGTRNHRSLLVCPLVDVCGVTGGSLGILLLPIATVPSSPSRLHHQLREASQASPLRLISTP